MTNGSCMELHYLFLKLFWVVDRLLVVQEDDSTSQQVKTFEGTWDSDAIAIYMVATKGLGSSASCLTFFQRSPHHSWIRDAWWVLFFLVPRVWFWTLLSWVLRSFDLFHLLNQTLCTWSFHLHYTIGRSRIPIPATVTFVYYHKILLRWCECSKLLPH